MRGGLAGAGQSVPGRTFSAFPEYRIDAIEQKEGVLVFRARARSGTMSDEEVDAVRRITKWYAAASEAVCEWCGRPRVAER